MSYLVSELERTLKKCSDCLLHPEYVEQLNLLYKLPLNQELVDYLCAKATSKKHIWETRFDHLRILLLNPTSRAFDLKTFYLENLKKSRRLAMKLFYIRGYAMYATEEELTPIMAKFRKSLEKNHDYIDYNYILSAAGLPYLVKTYGYDCFAETLEQARQEHEKIHPLLRGYFTLDEQMNQVNLLSAEEIRRRSDAFLEAVRNKKS